jgi:branched-chain amino acid transport system permease protein
MQQETSSTLRSALRGGVIMGIVSIFITLIGMLQSFAGRHVVGDITLTMVIVAVLGLVSGLIGLRQARKTAQTPGMKLLAGAVSGLVSGIMLALLLVLVSKVELREVLVNVTPEMVEALSFGLGISTGAILLIVVFLVLSVISVVLGLIPARLSKAIQQGVSAVLLVGLFWEVLIKLDVTKLILNAIDVKAPKVLSTLGGVIVLVVVGLISYSLPLVKARMDARIETRGASSGRPVGRWIGVGALIVFFIVLPQAVGLFWSQTLTTIGLFALMGLGLNIVVGMAGLLDLGYVAFYAIGAYTMALFSSPASSLATNWPFWVVLPIALLMATLGGVLLGIPVLRLRGDYLAIVTLGFGEIIRVLLTSDVLKPYLGGPQGILETPSPVFFGTTLDDPRYLYYLILAASLVVIFISTRLGHSRIGRAWVAMREDEDVAQAMGVNLVASKLMAFATGAAFAGVGGAIFAARQGAIFPADFTIFISINVLCLIIIGGLASTPGVLVGALFLIGLPEVLREIDEFRILAYGAGLVVMMIVRPEGLLPSARRRMELHQEETMAAQAASGGEG